MKIEVLYFDGCPNHEPTVERLEEVLREEGVTAEIIKVNVPDPATSQAVRFLGSPTIRVDELDIEPSARSCHDYGMTCRTYSENGRRKGLPSRSLIRAAIKQALARGSSASECCEPATRPSTASAEKSNRSGLLVASSVVAAVLASFCCILPIVFALTGFTIMGASAAFAEWRAYLLMLTFGLLGLGFYFAYRPAKGECGPGGVCTMPAPKRSGRLMLWLATAAIIGFAAFPYFSGTVAEFLLSQSHSEAAQPNQGLPKLRHASIAIEGMDCAACATAVENKLKVVPGVREAKVSFERGTAEVDYETGSASIEQLEKAVQEAGYRVLSKS
ncbi:MAG: mercuric transporter MerT family protein [Acidobacteriota bacterium]